MKKFAGVFDNKQYCTGDICDAVLHATAQDVLASCHGIWSWFVCS